MWFKKTVQHDGSDLKPGTRVGRYEIVRSIHHGGFSWVYYAYDNLGRTVVVKEYFPKNISVRKDKNNVYPIKGNEDFYCNGLRKFHDEAHILWLLEGIGTPTIKDFFEENSTFYLVLEKERGRTLSQYLRIPRSSKPPESEIRFYLSQLLHTLKKLHENNLYHLDLHPANIFLRLDKKLILLDYGSSKHTGHALTTTPENIRPYTPGYSPPEMLKNLPIGQWSDFYGVGAVLKAAGVTADSHYSEELKALVVYCMHDHSKSRPQDWKDPVWAKFM